MNPMQKALLQACLYGVGGAVGLVALVVLIVWWLR